MVYSTEVAASSDTLSYSISGTDDSYFNFDTINGEVRFVNSPNFEAKESYNFIVSVSDGSLSSEQEITININDINDAPSIESSSFGTLQIGSSLETVIYDADASDPDGDTLTYSLSGDDEVLVTIDPNNGEVRLISEGDFTTKPTYNFNVIVSDGTLEDTQSVTLAYSISRSNICISG